MLDVLLRTIKPLTVLLALAAIAVVGSATWAVTSSGKAAAVTAERDAAVAELAQLKEAAGQLAQLETRLGSARMEYGKVIQAWTDVRTKMGGAQQELAALTKRLDQAKERVAQTGSIRPADAPKRASVKP